jgi:signal transduction histidine kinase
MNAGGTLTLGWSRGEGDLVDITFSDTGIGIAPDDLKQLGKPFFTTKERGTGLGLAIAQRIVERHGGTLVVTSAPGRGTTVRVALPGTVHERVQAA